MMAIRFFTIPAVLPSDRLIVLTEEILIGILYDGSCTGSTKKSRCFINIQVLECTADEYLDSN